MRFNVVIVTFNRLQLLKECLNAAMSQTKPVNKIYVIDNCSTDGTNEYLDGLDNSVLTVLHSEKNLGGAWGFYQGVKLCHEQGDYDYLLLIDDDAILAPDCIEKLSEAAMSSPNSPALSTSVYVKGKIDTGHRCNFSPRLFARLAFVSEEEYREKTFLCDTATFCGLTVKKSTVSEIGFPAADLFIWFDDVEYSARIDKLGKILNVCDAKIDHKTAVPFSKPQIGWKSYYGYRNILIMTKWHMNTIATFYQVIRIAYYAIKYWSQGTMVSGNPAYKICLDALFDGIKGRLGANDKYLPSKK